MVHVGKCTLGVQLWPVPLVRRCGWYADSDAEANERERTGDEDGASEANSQRVSSSLVRAGRSPKDELGPVRSRFVCASDVGLMTWTAGKQPLSFTKSVRLETTEVLLPPMRGAPHVCCCLAVGRRSSDPLGRFRRGCVTEASPDQREPSRDVHLCIACELGPAPSVPMKAVHRFSVAEGSA